MQLTDNTSSFKHSSLRIRINICRKTGHVAVEVQDAVRWSSCRKQRASHGHLGPSTGNVDPPSAVVVVSRSVVSDSLWPHGLQHARLPCPSPSSRACSNSCQVSCNSIQPSRPLMSPSPPAFIRVFSNKKVLHIRWPKYWSFSFSINPSNEYSGLTFFRIDWFHLAVQGILKSLLQHHSLKALLLKCSAFFYCPALKSLHDYWKNHSSDYMCFCRQSNISAF